MKWKKYTIETTTAAEDFMSSMLMDLGIEGIEIHLHSAYQRRPGGYVY